MSKKNRILIYWKSSVCSSYITQRRSRVNLKSFNPKKLIKGLFRSFKRKGATSIDSMRCTSFESACKILAKRNISNIVKAEFYNKNGSCMNLNLK